MSELGDSDATLELRSAALCMSLLRRLLQQRQARMSLQALIPAIVLALVCSDAWRCPSVKCLAALAGLHTLRIRQLASA